MNVLLLTTGFPPEVGGLGAHVYRLAIGLAGRGHDVHVVLKRSRWLKGEANAYTEFRVSWRPTPAKLYRIVRSADVVHMNGFWTVPAALALASGKPLAWTHHEYDTSCPIGLGWYRGQSTSFSPVRCTRCMIDKKQGHQIPRRFSMLPVRRAFARQVSVNILPTQYIAGRLGLPKSKVIAYGVERHDAFRAVQHRSASAPTFGYFGRLAASKGCAVLLQALALSRRRGFDFRLDVYGEGPERAGLEQIAASLGVREAVSFKGGVSLNSVQAYMSSLNAVVVPSIWDEVAGIVALEAMAVGVPVIASDVGGLAEVTGDAAVLVQRGSPEALASALRVVGADPQLAERLRQTGQQRWASAYSADRMVDRHEALFEELI
jgi:glycosyltransferase involved in cell wall biosynthesis